MNNRVRIILAVLFIVAGTIIKFMLRSSDVSVDPDIIKLATGMLYGAGFVLIMQMLKKRKDQQQKEQE